MTTAGQLFDPPALVGLHARTLSLSADRGRARLSLHAQVDGADGASLEAAFALTAPNGDVHRASATVVDGIARAAMTIDAPTLWWTHDLGRPALHDLDATLHAPPGSADGVAGPRALDRRSCRVGIRSIELDRRHDETLGGRRFQLVLNGVPTVVRGTSWVPPRSLDDTADAAMRRDLVARAQEGNLTMLRVHDGGSEPGAFYDACDELGILVWQDLVSVSAGSPAGPDPGLVVDVEHEVRRQVERLRGRACLALWCGDDGILAMDDLLPAIVEELDPATPCWPAFGGEGVPGVEALLPGTTGLPADLDARETRSAAVQAEAMRIAIERARRQQPRTFGALIGQLHDGWSGASGAMIDADGIPTASYRAVARASAPVAASVTTSDGGVVEVWLANSTLARHRFAIAVEVGAFDGTGRSTETVIAVVPPGHARCVWSRRVRADARRYVWASSPDDAFPAARLHFADLAELEVDEGRLDVEVDDDALRITAHGYASGVHVAHPDARVRLTDDHFDLRDGETRRIGVTGADPRTLRVTRAIPRGAADREGDRRLASYVRT